MEKLAFESELGSKGHLSNIERGLARPNIQTLKVLADRLGLKLLDLVTFPEEDDRQRLVDRMRKVARGPIRKILNDLGDQGSKRRKGTAKGGQALAAAAPSAGAGSSRRKAGKIAPAAPASTGASPRRGAKARQGAAAAPSDAAMPATAGKRARKARPR